MVINGYVRSTACGRQRPGQGLPDLSFAASLPPYRGGALPPLRGSMRPPMRTNSPGTRSQPRRRPARRSRGRLDRLEHSDRVQTAGRGFGPRATRCRTMVPEARFVASFHQRAYHSALKTANSIATQTNNAGKSIAAPSIPPNSGLQRRESQEESGTPPTSRSSGLGSAPHRGGDGRADAAPDRGGAPPADARSSPRADVPRMDQVRPRSARRESSRRPVPPRPAPLARARTALGIGFGAVRRRPSSER